MKPVIKKQILTILILMISYSCSPDDATDDSAQPVNYSILVEGDNTISGTPDERRFVVFTDQQSLNENLALYVQSFAAILVDFTISRAILLSLGERSSGGYSIRTARVENIEGKNTVHVTIFEPGSNCSTTQSITSPYQFISVNSIQEFIFRESVSVVNCEE